jgi:ribosomal protein L11 methyltransferase
MKLGAHSAIGIEVDAQSNTIAEENADRNGVLGHLTFLTGDADVLGPLSGPADLICSNILRSVNTMLMPAILASLAPGGIVVFAGMEEPEEDLFLPVLAAHGMQRIDDVRDGNWWSVSARRA